jgi:tripartite-type tricarboxylate transporter receptor subunit TctC
LISGSNRKHKVMRCGLDHMHNLLTVMTAAFVGLGCIGMAEAQDYPTRPMTMIVPFPAGGATDTLARFLGEQMRGILGQPIIIENVAGAAGRESRTKFQFVPYRGNAPAMQDLLAGQIDFMIEPSSNFKSLIAAGSVKPFAITGRTRLASSPDIPTADEAGLPGFSASLWYGLWVPRDTPKDIIAKLNATLMQVLADSSVQTRLGELGIQITPVAQQSPEVLRAFQKAETERWWPIIKASNLKAE